MIWNWNWNGIDTQDVNVSLCIFWQIENVYTIYLLQFEFLWCGVGDDGGSGVGSVCVGGSGYMEEYKRLKRLARNWIWNGTKSASFGNPSYITRNLRPDIIVICNSVKTTIIRANSMAVMMMIMAVVSYHICMYIFRPEDDSL